MTDTRSLDFATYLGTTTDTSLSSSDLLPRLTEMTGNPNAVAVRWSGELDVPATGDYVFYIKGDNGFRLTIDGKVAIDHWTTDWDVQTQSDPVSLSAGSHTLQLDYNQGDGGANITTEWSGPGIERTAVPSSALHLPEGFSLGSDAKVTVAPSGTEAKVTFPTAVTSLPTDPSHHLAVTSGSVVWNTVSRAPGDPNSLIVSGDRKIPLGGDARFSYDGQAGLKTTSGVVRAQFTPAVNGSQYFFSTPFAAKVDKKAPLPEYPRPQLARKAWANLNGQWQFQPLTGDTPAPVGKLNGTITVPYPMESALSGVGKHHDWAVYRRDFSVDRRWRTGGQRVRLNFGAVDHEAWVYVNGKQVAHHVGGYTEFSADITDALVRQPKQTLTVKVHDSTDGTKYAVGKQSATPGGIWYTPSSGIWQTVWMEPVPAASVKKLVITPKLSGRAGAFDITVPVQGRPTRRAEVQVTVRSGKRVVTQAKGRPGAKLTLPIAAAHAWTPDDPFLYAVDVRIRDRGRNDEVSSYGALRTISVGKINGVNKILLNGSPTFLLSTLDQGFWPDGLNTAPTDEALAFDLVKHKELGFNTVRKHIKVEPARWYYHADKLGLMVWQDMPSLAPEAPESSYPAWNEEVHSVIDQLISVPSIVMWTEYNEGWGEMTKELTASLAAKIKAQDPSRLLDTHSGVNCCRSKGDTGTGDLIDWHMYHGPAFPAPDEKRAAADGEHGGYSYRVDGHTWSDVPGQDYGDAATSVAELTKKYVDNTRQLIPAAAGDLSGSVYTQITDVENELNGLYTYDRKVTKIDPAQVRKVNLEVIAAGAKGGQPPAPGTPGLQGVGWWQLHKDVRDAVTKVAGRIVGDGATWADGPRGGSVHLTGSQFVDTAEQPLNTTLGNFSIAANVRFDELGSAFQTIASVDGGSNSVFFLQWSGADQKLAFSFPGARALATKVDAVPGRWYHVVGTYDRTTRTVSLYVDGALAGTTTASPTELPEGNLVIGRGKWERNNVDFLHGQVADVHAYDRALPASEVATLAQGEPIS